ncbi:hypothetical protein IWQ56_000690 [Coemansia nantahalensis]|nr:hypothetical protein IWQ56_000690 [Coemansia nantahalensis]
MRWSSAISKPDVTVHPYSSQIIVTNGANANLIPGYAYVTVTRPTLVKSIDVSFEGVYSILWADGVGHAYEEYTQNRTFHCERIRLVAENLVSSTRPVQPIEGPMALCSQDLDGGWEDVYYSSSECEDEPPSYAGLEVDGCMDTSGKANSFVLPVGTHRFEFVFVVQPRMPSTIISHTGGIDYKLSVCVKTKGHLGLPMSTRAKCPIHIVNIPARFSLMQSSLSQRDETLFTRQIESSWWILVKVSSCTTFPNDLLDLSVCLSWPAMCDFDDDIGGYLELSTVQMDLCECTVHKSMVTGEALKDSMVVVASSLNGDSNLLGDAQHMAAPPRYDMLQEEEDAFVPSIKASSSSGSGSDTTVNGDGALDEGSGDGVVPTRADNTPRSMFNERQAQRFQLQIPRQRDMNDKSAAAGGIHIDCRSTPISITHQLRVTLQILDRVTRRLHVVPFHSRLMVIPEAESFLLPAYALSLQDARVQ